VQVCLLAHFFSCDTIDRLEHKVLQLQVEQQEFGYPMLEYVLLRIQDAPPLHRFQPKQLY